MTVANSVSPVAPPAIPRRDGGYRDTVESILIAFILAFIFRAFVVEAFVIPTGSMAPTLLGAHARFTCDDCGYQFDVNYSTRNEDQDAPALVPAKDFADTDCPNCGHRVHDDNGIKPVPIYYGDRILVMKYLYLLNAPKRWDVIVFKSPDDPEADPSNPDKGPEVPTSPGKTWYTTNFIKRLVGRPGESLMVLDGDIYVSEKGGTSLADFKVQRKPRDVQDALWRIVCDGDFVPHEELWQPWRAEPDSGWDIGTEAQPRRVYRFDNLKGGGTIAFDNSFNKRRAFTDFLAYAASYSGHNNVSDVKLSFLYDRKSGDGPLRLHLRKLNQMFTAELTRGVAKLYRKSSESDTDGDLGKEIASANVGSLASGSPIQIDFMNVDYGVILRVGDVDVLSASYEPDVGALKKAFDEGDMLPKPQVRISAASQTCDLSHVTLWRDVYYTNREQRIRTAQPGSPVQLGPDEYFAMGDNTVISQDARYWRIPVKLPAEELDVQAGRVPGRFLLGKAFFVYWPAGYRPFGKDNLPGLIPNFGDMRFIH